MHLKINYSFEKIKYSIIALFLNVSLITNLFSLLFKLIIGDSFNDRALLTVVLLIIPLTFFMYKIMIVKKLLKAPVYVLFAWLSLIIISCIVNKPPEFLLNQAIVAGFTHILLPVILITEVSNKEAFLNALTKYILISAVYCCIQFFVPFTNRAMYYGFTYASLLPGLISLALIVVEKKVSLVFCFLLIFIVQVLLGGRAVFSCYGIEVLLLLFFYRKYKSVVLLLFFLSGISVLIFIFQDALLNLLSEIIPNARFVKFLTGSLEDNSRLIVWKALLTEFINNPFTVRGILSDRVAIGELWGIKNEIIVAGWYSHNFIVEIIYQFGLLGMTLVLLFFKIVANTFKRTALSFNKTEIVLFSVFTSLLFGKLLISSSYLIDIQTGSYLGILLLLNDYNRKI